jgi:hypothetical protein
VEFSVLAGLSLRRSRPHGGQRRRLETRFQRARLRAGHKLIALRVEDIFREAGFPENVFRRLLISSSQVDAVIEHPRVAAVTLTGSTQAGKAVGEKTGAKLKKSVLELGGSDA